MSRCPLYLLMCAVLCGCGNTNIPEGTTPAATPVAAPAKDETKQSDIADNKAEPKKEGEGDSAEQPAEEAQQADYQPPFPDRENLFLAPRRSASNTKAPGTVEQSVELLGFANVAGPRVILSINGNVVPIAEGGQEAGIEVISIQPPAVVLQRDRERWQATLEN